MSPAVGTFTVTFYTLMYGRGQVVGSITREVVDGDSGAQLFAGASKKGIRSVRIANQTAIPFAIGQIRTSQVQ